MLGPSGIRLGCVDFEPRSAQTRQERRLASARQAGEQDVVFAGHLRELIQLGTYGLWKPPAWHFEDDCHLFSRCQLSVVDSTTFV